jgi:ABC-type transport system involved in multi-copper enzyme maturation permease subunit
MKFQEIFRFELACQRRQRMPQLFFVAVAAGAFLFVRGNYLADALYADFYINSPFVIAGVTVFCSLFWFLLAATVAGRAGARDGETGIHPLTYTAPVGKAAYLGGRFLAAFVLNALILLGVTVGVVLAVYLPGVDATAVGPFRPAAYLTAYGYIALPNAFVATAIQFAWAALSRRAIAAYLGSVLLFFVAYGGMILMGIFLENRDLGALLDVFGHVYITSEAVLGWTPLEKSTRLIGLTGWLLWSRLLWIGIALGALALTYARFRFVHPTASTWWSRLVASGKRGASSREVAALPGGGLLGAGVTSLRGVRQSFGFSLQVRQTLAIAGASFRASARSLGGFVLLAALGTLGIFVLILPEHMHNMGTPLLPRTEYVLTFLTSPLTNPFTPWVVTPLFIVLLAGELVWRERQAGLGEITDAAPVPEWVSLLGKFFGLALLLLAWTVLLLLAGVLVQVRLGYDRFEPGLYLRVLFGLQLPEYLLFALLALVVQGAIKQKYVGHLVALLAYVFILFAAWLGIRHHLLVYGSGPGWTYSDISGFGASLGPWAWFKAYWAAWALLLAAGARLFWMRGNESGLRTRLRLARQRFTRPTAWVAVAAGGLVLALGGTVFYNTNVLNEYRSDFERAEQRAEYERRYARYAKTPQPKLTATALHLEIYPERRTVDLRGTYRLVNQSNVPIDSVHVAIVPGGVTSVETGAFTFDRPAAQVLTDDALGHRIYALNDPLRPGDSLRLGFEVHVKPRGFGNGGVEPTVTPKSTYFTNDDWLPAIGYQPRRELFKPGDRRAHGLAARPLIPTLAAAEEESRDLTGEAHHERASTGGIAFEAVVGTSADQTAVAPGALRRTWTAGGRRYFRYATDAPIGHELRFFSAAYAVHEEVWRPTTDSGRGITIQIFHHPKHAANLDWMRRSVRASLDYYTRQFGPYPYGYIRLVENPGRGVGMHAEAGTIDYTEGFARFDPNPDPKGLNLPFAVVAHEMGHQFQPPYALAEGAGLLTESFAWYAAMGVVEKTYGSEHLRRLLRFFRQPQPIPPIRQSVPLLRAADPYAAYRKGPFALHALSEYIGKERVNGAYRRLIEKRGSGTSALPTSLDLYSELRAVTPDSLQTLLHDLFEANTFWELKTERATAKPAQAGTWQVTLDVRARKVTVNPAGVETEVPMGDWVPIGVFAPTGEGAEFGRTLYLRRHRIRAGKQTLTLTVPGKPSDAGIDPYHLLIDLEPFDNVEQVKVAN